MDLYNIETESIEEPIFIRSGTIEPLCNNCVNPSCPFNIELKDISIFGVNKKWRLLNLSNDFFRMVVDCDGYIGKDERDFFESMEGLNDD